MILAPSLLSADSMRFGEEIADAERCGADWHHLDVMDGHFVPNLTFGIPLVRALKRHANIPIDVHIMVTNPDETAIEYVKAGADYLVFHVEASHHAHRLCQAIRAAGAQPGIALNPGTPLEMVTPLLPFVATVNVMSVNPGFGGQAFIPESVERIRLLAEVIRRANLDDQVLIQVDGGINEVTAAQVVAVGASVLVAGNYLYGAKDRKAAFAALRALDPSAKKASK